MNERIRELAEQATTIEYGVDNGFDRVTFDKEKFAELIVEDCRTVITELYQNTPLELCGPLLSADEEIMKHFYGVEE